MKELVRARMIELQAGPGGLEAVRWLAEPAPALPAEPAPGYGRARPDRGAYGPADDGGPLVGFEPAPSYDRARSDRGAYGPSDDGGPYGPASPPPRKKQPSKRPKQRPRGYSPSPPPSDLSLKGFAADEATLSSRVARFGGASSSSASNSKYGFFLDRKYQGAGVINGGAPRAALTETDYEDMTVKGTRSLEEKDFFRLTAPPKPEDVRPVPVLKRHLQTLMRASREEQADYAYLCSQFKAIRQDLTVQRVDGAFAVVV
jgi:hypothetical protein